VFFVESSGFILRQVRKVDCGAFQSIAAGTELGKLSQGGGVLAVE
jgi:hypothetical protein